MKQIKSILMLTVLFMTTFFSVGVVYGQQDKKPEEKGKQEPAKTEAKTDENAEKKPVGSYLDVSHAKDSASEDDDFIRDHIYRLQVVVANYGEASDKSALESIQKEHLQGKKELFKRKYLNASNILKKVKKDIHTLFLSLSTRYQTKANEILGLCAEALVDKEIGMGNKADTNVETAGKTSRKIAQNRIKLLIAYDHLNMGDRFKSEERLYDALTHYRLAKLHGINILVDMAESEGDKSNVKSKYKVDLSDGENLVSK